MTQPTITELHKPRLTPRKSERNLAISKADQKTPTHMHNDVALIGETTNIISRTHISHSPSYVTRPSLNHLPMSGQNLSVNKEISSHIEGISSTQTTPHVNSENGSIHMASVQALDQSNNPNSSPNMDPFSILSAASLSQTENLPFQGQLNKQFYNQSDIHLAVSQENDAPVHPAIRSAPWMDWPTSNMSSAKSNPNSYSQPLSYASFDDPYFGFSGFTPSSDDILEADQFLPFLTIDGASNNDAYGSASHNVDSESDLSHITPFSDGHTTANVLPLAPSNLKSIDIDEILKVAETDASTLQRQL
ncbi:Copper fist DNA binding domain protein [Penicillium brevicompactum]|uniref:Copper fist DNA binding domain protein n=1 Tax=Penicillium brevicompactum TaxID=5074 RepID=A0A9W9QY63_PENBR|nr:Copper fist DNA binding domain protein [Penicillium brevicompactum]KAJ5343498.1 Copper fist DNA binding domain protein [Penicillium brevicompactum]KAJ5350252.1 Copper fist DNA binding domain protein [Penicillium brevicompactum]